MRKNAQTVADAWNAGTAKRASTISTDGHVVWSYGTPIAIRSRTGQTFVTTIKYSVTTSGHTDALLAAAPHAAACEEIKSLGGNRYRVNGKTIRVDR